MRNRTTYFELTGGLGNQLFQFYAALLYDRSEKLVFETSKISFVHYETGLKKYLLPHHEVCRCTPNRIITLYKRTINAILLRSVLARLVSQKVFKVYKSGTIGYEDAYMHISNLRRISGYFQSYKYLPLSLKSDGLKLRHQSKRLTKLITEMDKEDPIVIHVRGGDYRELSSSVGILSPAYYQKALEIMCKNGPTENVWVFTNDRLLTEEILHDIPIKNIRIVSEEKLNTAESLTLMSNARRIIISNSTYSWWAAFLGSDKKVILAPKKWYMNMPDPIDLIPSDWIKTESYWQDH